MKALKNRRIIITLVIVILGLTFLFPIFWMLDISFKGLNEIYTNPIGLPHKWILSNYSNVTQQLPLFRYFLNTVIYTVGTIVITLVCGVMLAYCLARMTWKLSGVVYTYISMGLVIPVSVTIIPLFLILRNAKLMNTYIGMILPYAAFALSSCVLMLFAFFRTLPRSLEESATIDGASIFTIFVRIILPMAKPAIATQVIIIFMNTWNDYFLGYMLTNQDAYRPISVGLALLINVMSATNWGLIGAGAVIASIPTIVIYVVFSEQIENALSASALLK